MSTISITNSDYHNTEMYIHGKGNPFPYSPDISIDFKMDKLTRSGKTLKCTVKASLNALNGSSYFGYSIDVYAQLSGGSSVTLISKDNSPSQWGDDAKSSGTKTLSCTNTSGTTVSLKIYMKANCPDCNHSSKELLYTLSISDIPPYAAPFPIYRCQMQDGKKVWVTCDKLYKLDSTHTWKKAKLHKLTSDGWKDTKN